MTITVRTASIIPINAWYVPIAISPGTSGKVPAIVISTAQARAAIRVASHAPIAIEGYLPIRFFNPLNVYKPTHPPIIPIFKTFNPKVVIPPSPKSNA